MKRSCEAIQAPRGTGKKIGVEMDPRPAEKAIRIHSTRMAVIRSGSLILRINDKYTTNIIFTVP